MGLGLGLLGVGLVLLPGVEVRWLLLLPGVGFNPLRVDSDAGFAKFVGCGVLAVVVKKLELVERGDGAIAAAAGRELLVGTGVAGERGVVPVAGGTPWLLDEFCAPSAPDSVCCRLMSGDLKGFRRVTLAASIRRRLAVGPPGVWNDISRVVIKAHLRLILHCFVGVLLWVLSCVQETDVDELL